MISFNYHSRFQLKGCPRWLLILSSICISAESQAVSILSGDLVK